MSSSSSSDSSSRSSDEESSSSEPEQQQEEYEHKNKKAKKDNEKKKKKTSTTTNNIPPPLELAPETSTSNNSKNTKEPIIVLLDQATLEIVKSSKGNNNYELLNCDDHRDLCKKKLKKDPNVYRPDILHQELLALLDSPLNKAGLLKVYILTQKKVLIDVHSSIRIPRTYKRFAGLMVQLLHKLKIKASSGDGGKSNSTTLLKVIKNPFSQYLPPGTRCYGFSCQGTLYNPYNLAKHLCPPCSTQNQPPICFVFGAMSTGHITIEDHPYIEEMLSISNYPLSGATALSRLMGGIEHLWGIF